VFPGSGCPVPESPASGTASAVSQRETVVRVVNPTGSVGMIGVYIAPDPGAKNDAAKRGVLPFLLADYFDKGISMGSGQAPVKKYNEYLRDLIVNGRAKPSQIVSHGINIEEAPDAYDKFDKRIDGYTKVLIKFEDKAAA
jgi:glutathione-independent formaldehyde dehydrogenase